MAGAPLGVSVVICCHNSASRLPETLAHLAAQVGCEGIPWEVIVVDNASTDDTARVAERVWPSDAPAPLRVVREPRLGLTYARQRGFAEARYDVVGFVDDDNWVCREWVSLASRIMTEHPEVGAAGGDSEAVFGGEKPWWFDRYQKSYAVGPQATQPGYLAEPTRALWGAGLAVRKAAWESLIERGFRPLLVGRRGAALTSGEDTELCYALRLAGWQLWYEPRLRIRHYLPPERLTWEYQRRLRRGFGQSSLGYVPYHNALRGQLARHGWKRSWWYQWCRQCRILLSHPRALLQALLGRSAEGDSSALQIEHSFGRLTALLRTRGRYDQSLPWLVTTPPERDQTRAGLWRRERAHTR